MNELTPYLGFLAVSLMVALSPGPSWVYTISTTLGYGRKAGMIGNLGNSTGILCHAIAVAFGLSALIRFSSTAFIFLKFVGVAYLIYLAVQTVRGSSALSPSSDSSNKNLWQIYRNGAYVSIFNPKISLLMLALLPQFVDPVSPNQDFQIGIMGALHAVTAGIVHSHVVFFSDVIARRCKASGKVQKVIRWATASLFFCFGIRLAFSDQQ